MLPIGRNWAQVHVRYYLIAILFLIFDVETVFIFPWAITFLSLPDLRLLRDARLRRRPRARPRLRLEARRPGVEMTDATQPTALRPRLRRRSRTPAPGRTAGDARRLPDRPARRHADRRRYRHRHEPQELALADDLRPRLLRHRDDRHLHGQPRPRPLRHRAVAEPAPERRDDRLRHGHQEDGARRSSSSTSRCRTRSTSSPWAPAPPMAAPTPNTTASSRASTRSSRSMSTSPAARRAPNRSSMASSRLQEKIMEEKRMVG